ncbi:MAG: bifunctional enoyl-CoA hydratase/phosphate acetyltransferase [Nitrospirae bacterium]|nr:MAG: bifunctional enoyl-CoA hydratase/phosphate acetyltransferase [Nitrospirota bacterium]
MSNNVKKIDRLIELKEKNVVLFKPIERTSPPNQLKRILSLAEKPEPIPTAVVHPTDEVSLEGSVDAAKAGLIVPVLVGPEHKIRAAAERINLDLTPYTIVNTRHSHESAKKAVELVREGLVSAIMKGYIHTDELMHEVVSKENGITTERRISHVFVMDLETYEKPLFVTDAAINISPTLMDKRDIVQNAIDLAHIMHVEKPKVALLSAVETVTPRLQSTIDAAALCKMADRKQIVGGILDGPLAFDNAISKKAAEIKGIESEVAGDTDILVAPDLEAGNILAKQLHYLANAQSAGIVLGARVPIILTSRADDSISRRTSCAIALLIAQKQCCGIVV